MMIINIPYYWWKPIHNNYWLPRSTLNKLKHGIYYIELKVKFKTHRGIFINS